MKIEKITGALWLMGLAALIMLLMAWVQFENVAVYAAKDRAELGHLGDYFGGVLSAVFGFFGFVALLITIVIQLNTLKSTRDEMATSSKALRDQVNHLKIEAKKADLYRVIEKVNDEIKSALKESFTTRTTPTGVTLGQILSVFGDERINIDILNNNDQSSGIVTFAIFEVSILFHELGEHLETFREYGGDRSVSTYFCARLDEYISTLVRIGFLDERTKNSICGPNSIQGRDRDKERRK